MKPIQISDFKKGHSVHGFYVCNEKQVRHAKNGDLFLDMIFSDSTGMISAKLWDMVYTGKFVLFQCYHIYHSRFWRDYPNWSNR